MTTRNAIRTNDYTTVDIRPYELRILLKDESEASMKELPFEMSKQCRVLLLAAAFVVRTNEVSDLFRQLNVNVTWMSRINKLNRAPSQCMQRSDTTRAISQRAHTSSRCRT